LLISTSDRRERARQKARCAHRRQPALLAVAVFDAWSSADRVGLPAHRLWIRADDAASAPDQDYLPISADRGKRAGYGLDFLLPRPPGDNG
jgi:hypothetical protein